MKTLTTLVILLLGTWLINAPLAQAHALKENSARITFREGQVELRLNVAMQPWQAQLQNHQAWLMGDIAQVMPDKLSAQQKKQFIAKLLRNNTLIEVNQQSVVLSLQAFNKTAQGHGDYVEIVMTGKHTQAKVDYVQTRFPNSLGAVHTSFVKPKYKMLPAGKTAHISFVTDQTKTIELAAHKQQDSWSAHQQAKHLSKHLANHSSGHSHH